MHTRGRVRVLSGHLILAQQDHEIPFRLQPQCTRATASSKMLGGQVHMPATLSGSPRPLQRRLHVAITLQVAIITGSGQGVGAAAAQLFAEQGAKVVVTDIDAGKSEQVRSQRYNETSGSAHVVVRVVQVASSIREAGGEALSVPGDVTADDFAPKIIKATIEKYGALHILVNNAGDLPCTCESCIYANVMLISQSSK